MTKKRGKRTGELYQNSDRRGHYGPCHLYSPHAPPGDFPEENKKRFIRSFLAYVPYAVLAAMTFPEILYSTSNVISAVAGLLVALVLSYLGGAAYRGAFFHGGGLCGGTDFKMDGTSLDRYN